MHIVLKNYVLQEFKGCTLSSCLQDSFGLPLPPVFIWTKLHFGPTLSESSHFLNNCPEV